MILSPDAIILMGIGVFFASVCSAVAGFGGGFLILVLFYFFPPHQAVAIATLVAFISNITKVLCFYRYIDWKFSRNFLLMGIPCSAITVFFLFPYIPARALTIIIGCLGLYTVVEHFVHIVPRVKNFTPKQEILFGGIWGALSGISNASLFKAMVLKWKDYKKEVFIGTSGIIVVIAGFVKIPGYIYNGFLPDSQSVIILPLTVLCILGTFLGKWLLKFVSIKLFDYLLVGMIALGSVYLLIFG